MSATDPFDPDPIGRSYGEEPPADADPPLPVRALLDFRVKQGSCIAGWGAPLYVTIELDRFGDERGELRAEVVMRYTAPGLERQLLAPRRVPLLGTRAIAELARDLAKRQSGIPWPELLELAFTEAIGAHREGEPPIALPDVPTRIAPLYALQPLALRDLLTVVWSRPGEGKTWIACAVAAALQSGRDDILGLAPSRSMRVGILDWEDDQFTKAERVRAITGDPVPGITYVACRSAIWDELDRITRVVRERELEYLIVDSLGMACGGLPPESSEAALRCGTAIRRLGLGTFATAHLPKDGANESAPFGSIFWLAQLRLGWFVKRQVETTDADFTLGLFCKKSNNDRTPMPLGYEVAFEGLRATFRRRDVHDVPELAGKLSVKERILGALRSGPKTIEELAGELCVDEKQIHARVSEVLRWRTPAIIRRPDGRVALAVREPA